MRIACLIAAATLCACASDPYRRPAVVDRGPQPANAQLERVIKAQLLTTLKDPTSLRDFEITNVLGTRYYVNPTLPTGPLADAWLVCFQYNAKNGYGAYTGLSFDGWLYRLGSDGEPSFVMKQTDSRMTNRC